LDLLAFSGQFSELSHPIDLAPAHTPTGQRGRDGQTVLADEPDVDHDGPRYR
jgi:hypothetical protein